MEHFSSAVLSKVSYVDLSVMERPPSLTIVRKVVDVGVVVISSLGGGGRGGGGGGDIEFVVRFEESRTFFSLLVLLGILDLRDFYEQTLGFAPRRRSMYTSNHL